MEAPIEGRFPWFVYASFYARDGGMVLAEVRVFPGPDREMLRDAGYSAWSEAEPNLPKIGEWSPEGVENFVVQDADTERPAVPEGGIVGQLLREVPTSELVAEYVRVRSEHERRLIPRLAKRLPPGQPERPGKAGRDDRFYLPWAIAYAEALAEDKTSRAPVEAVARKFGVSRTHARDMISQARRRRLLPHASQGRAGGQLTQKALDLIANKEDK
jgi:hypothetical protein